MGIGNVLSIIGKTTIGKGGIIFSFGRLFLRYWFVALTVMSVFFVMWDSIVLSFKTGSLQPFIDSFGGKIFMIDYQLYNYLNSTTPATTLWGSVSQFIEIVSSIWILFFIIFIIAKLIAWSPLSNDSNRFINWAIAIIFVYFLVSSYCVTNNESLGIENESTCFVPFKGLTKLSSDGIDFFKPLTNFLRNYFNKKTKIDGLNETLNETFNNVNNFSNINEVIN